MKRFCLLALALGAAQAQEDWGRVRADLTTGVMISKDRGDFTKRDLYLAFGLDKNWMELERAGLHTCFEARMTTIPVEQPEMIGSAKVAALEGCIYAPIFAARWKFGEEQYSLFAAPLVRVAATTGTASDRFTTSAAYGVRLGHNKGAEPVSHLDVAIGRFSNLGGAGDWRYAIDGSLSIPGTPLFLGVSANIGRASGSRDDLRFLFGARFNASDLLHKLGL